MNDTIPAPAPFRPRVVHVLTRLGDGGAEENTIGTCLGQLELGYEVHLLHGEETLPEVAAALPASLHRERIPVLVHPVSPGRDARAIRELRRAYRRIDPDIVHTHQSKAGVLGRLACAGLSGVTVVHTVHIAPFLSVGRVTEAVYLSLEHAAARFTDRFISVSDGMRDAYRHRRIGGDKPHVVVHSGMPLERFRHAVPPSDWGARLDIDAEHRPFTVLMLASFEPRKRQLEFLEAARDWLRATPDALVCLAGHGPRLERTKAWVREHDLEGSVRFLGHDPNPEELIALADVCVLCSEREGLPRVLVQYVAARRRVLAMHLPGIEELLDAYPGATVTPADDFGGFVERLVRIHAEEYLPERRMPEQTGRDLSSWEMGRMVESIDRLYRMESDASAEPDARSG